VYRWYVHRIHRQDFEVCEGLQGAVHQASGQPMLSLHETRVGWFEEEYARYVRGT
jgi:hypothetical protein